MNNTRALISVIMPVYNKEIGVANSIHSVLNQDYDYLELIVVNDGSTDGSMDIVNTFNDNRMVIVEQENMGPAAARNTGTKHSKGQWLVFLDADDELSQGALKEINRMANKYRRAGLLSFSFFEENGTVFVQLPRIKRDSILFSGYIAWLFMFILPYQGSYAIKREIALSAPFPEQYRRWEDAGMFVNAIRNTKVACSNFKSFTYHHSLSQACIPPSDYKLDYICNLSLKNMNLFQKTCLYSLCLQEGGRMVKMYHGDNFSKIVKFAYRVLMYLYHHHNKVIVSLFS